MLKNQKSIHRLSTFLCLLIITHTRVTLLTEAPTPAKETEDRTLCNENSEGDHAASLTKTEAEPVVDRKLNGGELSYEGSREAADSREESPLNKVSHSDNDKYGQMDIIVNDIKQVGGFLL